MAQGVRARMKARLLSRLERLEQQAGSSEVSVAYQAEEVLRHWRETGEFSCSDGSHVPIAVFRQIIGAKG